MKKYDFVVDEDLLRTWWKGEGGDDSDALVAMTTQSRQQVTDEAKNLLEMIKNGDLHLILGLQKRLPRKEIKPENAVKNVGDDNKDSKNKAGGGGVVKSGAGGVKGDDMEISSSPRDEEEEEDNGYTPSKKRQKFSAEKQAEGK